MGDVEGVVVWRFLLWPKYSVTTAGFHTVKGNRHLGEERENIFSRLLSKLEYS